MGSLGFLCLAAARSLALCRSLSLCRYDSLSLAAVPNTALRTYDIVLPVDLDLHVVGTSGTSTGSIRVAVATA